MPKISKSIEINATPQECYDVVFDFESYPEYLKEAKGIVVKKQSGHTADVTFSIEVIKKLSYTLKMIGKPPKKISWTLVSGDMMKKNNGSWSFEVKGVGVTQATYALDLELGLFVPGPIAKMLIGNNLAGMLKSVKQRVEGKKK